MPIRQSRKAQSPKPLSLTLPLQAGEGLCFGLLSPTLHHHWLRALRGCAREGAQCPGERAIKSPPRFASLAGCPPLTAEADPSGFYAYRG